MQDPNEDTQWNDVLRAKGIIPQKEEKEITEDDIIGMVENAIHQKTTEKDMSEMTRDELDEIEDDIDEEEERIFEEYKRKRMAEMLAAQEKARFGSVREITKSEYVEQVNKAGEGVWVVLHIYKPSIPLCKLVNEYLNQLAQKFPATKFMKSISELCIPNYPDKNLPTIFIYYEGEMKKQFIGPLSFKGMNLKFDELEWMLSETGAFKTTLEENPSKPVHDVMSSAIRSSGFNDTNSSDDDDY